MSLRPELLRALAEVRRLPSGADDWEAWQRASEAVEGAVAALEADEALDREEPALAFLPGGGVPGSRAPAFQRFSG
jgi:hypothetical protein